MRCEGDYAFGGGGSGASERLGGVASARGIRRARGCSCASVGPRDSETAGDAHDAIVAQLPAPPGTHGCWHGGTASSVSDDGFALAGIVIVIGAAAWPVTPCVLPAGIGIDISVAECARWSPHSKPLPTRALWARRRLIDAAASQRGAYTERGMKTVWCGRTACRACTSSYLSRRRATQSRSRSTSVRGARHARQWRTGSRTVGNYPTTTRVIACQLLGRLARDDQWIARILHPSGYRDNTISSAPFESIGLSR